MISTEYLNRVLSPIPRHPQCLGMLSYPDYDAHVFVNFPFVPSPELPLQFLNHLNTLHYLRILEFVHIESQEGLAVVRFEEVRKIIG